MDQNKEPKPAFEQPEQSWPRLHKLLVKGEVRFIMDTGPVKFVDYDPVLAADLFAQMQGAQPKDEAAA